MALPTRRAFLRGGITGGSVLLAGCSSLPFMSSGKVDPYFYGIEVCNDGEESFTLNIRATREDSTIFNETSDLSPEACRGFRSDDIAGVPVAETTVEIQVSDGDWQTLSPDIPDNDTMECVELHVDAMPDKIDAIYYVPSSFQCPEPDEQ